MYPELDSLYLSLSRADIRKLRVFQLENFGVADFNRDSGSDAADKIEELAFQVMGQSMRIVTSLLPELMATKSAGTDVAVVVDVLRATSVMTTAFGSGVKRIFTCCQVAEAVSLAEQIENTDQENQRPLLCGERSCKPISGFDHGNSPSEYTPERVRGQTLIMTTTNGTKAIEAAFSAKRLIAASFLNLPKVVETLARIRVGASRLFRHGWSDYSRRCAACRCYC